MAKLIKATGPELEVSPKNGKTFSLVELQKLTNADTVELLSVGSSFLIFDEDGLRKFLPGNDAATVIAGRFLVGDVLVCKQTDID
jgi:hypothetical protein